MQAVDAFIQRHGGKPVRLKGRWLLPDGAELLLSGPVFKEPSGDLEQRLRNQLEYRETRLTWALSALAALEAAARGLVVVSGQLSWDRDKLGPMPPGTDRYGNPDPDTLMARLKFLIACRKAEVLKVQAEIDHLFRRQSAWVQEETDPVRETLSTNH